MDQQAIFIDAGFLLAVGGMQTAGTSLRSASTVDYESLITGIVECTEAFSGMPTLRTYWYDASKDALFTDHQKRIGLISGVKVRLGRMSMSGEQKGVDLKLGLDLVGLARSRAAGTMFLLSGDDDLAEAVEAAQDLGVKVVLVAVEDASQRLGFHSVAEHLALRVDSIVTLPAGLIEKCFRKQAKAAVPRPVPAGAGAGATTGVAVGAGVVGGEPKPTPVAVAHGPATASVAVKAKAEAAHLVFRSDSANGSGERSVSLLTVADEIGSAVAESWYNNTTQAALNDLLADRPVLPIDVDRVLLRDCAQKIGEANTDMQSVRRELRHAFWDRLDQLT